MAGEMTSDVKHLRKTVDALMSLFQDQMSRKNEENARIQSMALKIDVQAQTIQTMEKDIRKMKECMESDDGQSAMKRAKMAGTDTPNPGPFTSSSASIKEEIIAAIIKANALNKEELVNLVKSSTAQKSDVLKMRVLVETSSTEMTELLMEAIDGLEELQEKVDMCQSDVMHNARSIIDQLMAEHQITRGVVRGNNPTKTLYTCDFHAMNYSRWVETGESQYSRAWYIHEGDSYVKGRVHVDAVQVGEGKDKYEYELSVWLVHGWSPRSLGLKPELGVKFWVKVKVVDQSPALRSGGDWDLGITEYKQYTFDQKTIAARYDGWEEAEGVEVAGKVPCKEIDKRKIVYNDNVLFRFEISAGSPPEQGVVLRAEPGRNAKEGEQKCAPRYELRHAGR